MEEVILNNRNNGWNNVYENMNCFVSEKILVKYIWKNWKMVNEVKCVWKYNKIYNSIILYFLIFCNKVVIGYCCLIFIICESCWK